MKRTTNLIQRPRPTSRGETSGNLRPICLRTKVGRRQTHKLSAEKTDVLQEREERTDAVVRTRTITRNEVSLATISALAAVARPRPNSYSELVFKEDGQEYAQGVPDHTGEAVV